MMQFTLKDVINLRDAAMRLRSSLDKLYIHLNTQGIARPDDSVWDAVVRVDDGLCYLEYVLDSLLWAKDESEGI